MHQHRQLKHQSASAFTLIECLIVISIIALLLAPLLAPLLPALTQSGS